MSRNADRTQQFKEISYFGECCRDSVLSCSISKETDIEAWFDNNGIQIKKDKAITVKTFTFENFPPLICKRFSQKNNFYFLKTLFLGHKACHLWKISRIFLGLGIAVPRPIGYIISGNNPFRRSSFFFCDLINVKTLTALSRSMDDFSGWLANNGLLQKLAQSLAQMHNSNYSHGDTKWENIMVNPSDGLFWWIDLDSARQRSRQNNRWFDKDVARFAISLLESTINPDRLDIFITNYAQTRGTSAALVKKRIEPFIKKIATRHKEKTYPTTVH